MHNSNSFHVLKEEWKKQALAMGFTQAQVVDLHLTQCQKKQFQENLAQNLKRLDYMQKNVEMRLNPQLLLENAQSALLVSLPYAQNDAPDLPVSLHALGRDYHKVVRNRLKKVLLSFQPQLERILPAWASRATFRIFCDSAPVLEKVFAAQTALGWRGKNSLIVSRKGSFFFLGGILTNLPLPADPIHLKEHCGQCTRCVEACPTQAILPHREIDAERCIAFWLNEFKGKIPRKMCAPIGVRIYGCDVCQRVCPWNKFAHPADSELSARAFFQPPDLFLLFAWDEMQFLKNLEGSAIRRIGFSCWQRNVAIALCNSVWEKGVSVEKVRACIEQKMHQCFEPEWLKAQFLELLEELKKWENSQKK